MAALSLVTATAAAAVLSLIATAAAAADHAYPDAADVPYAQSRSYLRTAGRVQSISFVCAPLDGVDMTVVGPAMAGSRVWIAQPLSGEPPTVFKVGTADPGAGQVYWPLSNLSGKEVGDLHAFNPDALGDPKAAATPTFTEIRVNAASWNCRWLEHTRLLGFSARRVVEITSGPGGFEYRTFDFKDAGKLKRIPGGAQDTTTASLDIKGGRLVGGRMHFEHQGYAYDVTGSAADARITISKGGRRVAVEPLVAWTLGPAAGR